MQFVLFTVMKKLDKSEISGCSVNIHFSLVKIIQAQQHNLQAKVSKYFSKLKCLNKSKRASSHPVIYLNFKNLMFKQNMKQPDTKSVLFPRARKVPEPSAAL